MISPNEADHRLLQFSIQGDGNNALFFPIIPGDEQASWKQFAEEGIEKFFNGTFAGDYQEKLLGALEKALPELPPWKD